MAAEGLRHVVEPEATVGFRPMTAHEEASAGCLAVGTALLGVSYAVGAPDLIAILAGGAIAGATPPLIGVAVVSTVFASGCAIGAIGTPAILWAYEQSDALYAMATGSPDDVRIVPEAAPDGAATGTVPTLP